MSQLERDIESARNWLVSQAVTGLKMAHAHNCAESNLLSAVELITAFLHWMTFSLLAAVLVGGAILESRL